MFGDCAIFLQQFRIGFKPGPLRLVCEVSSERLTAYGSGPAKLPRSIPGEPLFFVLANLPVEFSKLPTQPGNAVDRNSVVVPRNPTRKMIRGEVPVAKLVKESGVNEIGQVRACIRDGTKCVVLAKTFLNSY